MLYGRSTPLVSHEGRLVSAHSKAKNAACSTAASQWRLKQATKETFLTLAVCRAQAAARGTAGKQRSAGNEAKAQVLEARASSGKVGAAHRAQLADEMTHVRSARHLARAIRNQGQPPGRDPIADAKARAARLPDFNAKVAGKPFQAKVSKSPVQKEASEAVGSVQAARLNFNKLRQETDDPDRLDVARRMVLGRFKAAQGPLKAARAEQAKDTARATPASPRSSEELTGGRTRGEPTATLSIKEPWQQTRAELLARNEQVRPNETGQPWQGERHPVGTWRMSDEHSGELEQLRHFDPHELGMTEDAGAGRNWEGFETYRDWAARGHEPPPVSVVRHADTGALISSNRRRVLAAQDARRPHIPGWFSETERPSGRPAWNHRAMVERAIREGKQVPAEVLNDYPDLRRTREPVTPARPTAPSIRQKAAAPAPSPPGGPATRVAKVRDDLALATEGRRALNLERQRELSRPALLLDPDRRAKERAIHARHDASAAAQDAEIARLQRAHDELTGQYPELARRPVPHTRPAQFISHGR